MERPPLPDIKEPYTPACLDPGKPEYEVAEVAQSATCWRDDSEAVRKRFRALKAAAKAREQAEVVK